MCLFEKIHNPIIELATTPRYNFASLSLQNTPLFVLYVQKLMPKKSAINSTFIL